MKKLPAAEMILDMREQGLTYQDIADQYGVSRQAVHDCLMRVGLVEVNRMQDEGRFWAVVSSVIALIREGYRTYPELAEKTGYSKTGIWQVVRKMGQIGLVEWSKGKRGTLRLTEQGERWGTLIQLATVNDKGVLVGVGGPHLQNPLPSVANCGREGEDPLPGPPPKEGREWLPLNPPADGRKVRVYV